MWLLVFKRCVNAFPWLCLTVHVSNGALFEEVERSEWDPQFGQHVRLVDNSSDVTVLFILASAPVALTGTGSRSVMERGAFGATVWRRATEEPKFG